MVHNVYSGVNLKQMHLNALQYSYKLYLTLNITIVINFDVTMVIFVNIHVIKFKKIIYKLLICEYLYFYITWGTLSVFRITSVKITSLTCLMRRTCIYCL